MEYAIDFERQNGIGQIQVRATTVADHATDFYGSVYGGPVFIDVGWGQVRVIDPERFGTFGSDPKTWVDSFYSECGIG